MSTIRPLLAPFGYLVGVASMLMALFLLTATFATNDYSPILRAATVFVGISIAGFATVAVIGSTVWRVIAAVSCLPLLYAIAELLRRNPW